MLGASFYNRNTKTVARELLGKIFVHGRMSGKIVETEAYLSKNDPGARGGRLFTNPPKELLGEPGRAFVYFTYGNHWMFNVVTERVGKAGAVLIRAVEPLSGIAEMKKNRMRDDIVQLSNGPGKFTEAFGINKSHNRMDLTKSGMHILYADERPKVVTTTRIGLNYGQDLPLRFYIKDNEFVSRK